MQATTSIPPLDTLSEGQRSALARLLADDDPEVFRHFHDAIAAQGQSARAWLEHFRLSDDARTRRRVRALLNQLNADQADSAFLSFCLTQGETLDFEQALFLLSQTAWPDINPEGYRALLDSYAEEVRHRAADLHTPHRVFGTINRLLFLQLKFRGNSSDYHHADNNYLSSVLDSRIGNPITLSAVYLSVCRRLGLPVAGIGLPGHFLCRFQDAKQELYVDPFHGGRFMNRSDCVLHLVRSNCEVRDEYLAPMSPRKMLLRTLNNLHHIYQQQHETQTSLRIRGYLLALTNKMG